MSAPDLFVAPTAVRFPDGKLGVLIPPEALGWLVMFFGREGQGLDARRWSREKGGSPPESFFAIADVALAAAAGHASAVLTLDVDGETSARGNDLDLPVQDSSEWLSTSTAADRLGLSARRVRQLADAGRLPGARRVGRDWLVPVASVSKETRPRGTVRRARKEIA
jgi:excisionase family DNA binding protein